MVNLSTPTKQLVRELEEDFDKCEYWFKKKYHGDKGYQRMREDLMYKVATTKKQSSSDTIEYLSRNGNRWFVYECARYYDEAQMVKTNMYSVCYYETFGSIGAFLLNRSEGGNGVIIFTSHFFDRFKSRLGVDIDFKTLLRRFCEVIPGYTVQFKKERNASGYQKVDIRLPGSVGRGIVRKDGLVIEVRSYLTDKQMTRSQLKDTEDIRSVGDMQDYEPMDIWQERVRRLPFDAKVDEYQKKYDMLVKMGMPQEILNYMMIFIFSAFCTMYLTEKDIVKADDMQALEEIGKRMSGRMIDKVVAYHDKKIEDREVTQALGEFLAEEYNADIGDVYKSMDKYLRMIDNDGQRDSA